MIRRRMLRRALRELPDTFELTPARLDQLTERLELEASPYVVAALNAAITADATTAKERRAAFRALVKLLWENRELILQLIRALA